MAHPGDGLRLKGGESGVVLLWTCQILLEFGEHIPFAAELREVGASLSQYLDAIRQYPYVLSRVQSERLYSLMLRVNVPSKAAGITMVPKHHFFYELTKRSFCGLQTFAIARPTPQPHSLNMFLGIWSGLTWDEYDHRCQAWLGKRAILYPRVVCETPRAATLGNPSAYSCWTDETLNATLRTIGETTHKMTFYLRSFQSFRLIGALRLNRYIYGEADELPNPRPLGRNCDEESVALACAIVDQAGGGGGDPDEGYY